MKKKVNGFAFFTLLYILIGGGLSCSNLFLSQKSDDIIVDLSPVVKQLLKNSAKNFTPNPEDPVTITAQFFSKQNQDANKTIVKIFNDIDEVDNKCEFNLGKFRVNSSFDLTLQLSIAEYGDEVIKAEGSTFVTIDKQDTIVTLSLKEVDEFIPFYPEVPIVQTDKTFTTWDDLCNYVNNLEYNEESEIIYLEPEQEQITVNQTLKNNTQIIIDIKNKCKITADSNYKNSFCEPNARLSIKNSSEEKVVFEGNPQCKFLNCTKPIDFFIDNIDFDMFNGSRVVDCSFEGTENYSLSFTECVFKNNSSASGGAIRIEDKTTTGFNYIMFDSCEFDTNVSPGDGGAINILGNSNFTMVSFENCNFKSNAASGNGGAINQNNKGSILSIENCQFTDNSASESYSLGGAVYCKNGQFSIDTVTMSNNKVAENVEQDIAYENSNTSVLNSTFDGECIIPCLHCVLNSTDTLIKSFSIEDNFSLKENMTITTSIESSNFESAEPLFTTNPLFTSEMEFSNLQNNVVDKLNFYIDDYSLTVNDNEIYVWKNEIYYNVGDLILSDGTIVPYSNTPSFTADQINKAVAVICKAGIKDNALGLGLRQKTNLAWCSSNGVGYETNFTNIQCTPKKGEQLWFDTWQDGITWQGDTEGFDNWDEICKVDVDGTTETNRATNYPAFNYALTYTSNDDGDQNLQGTSYENDWFLPSIFELVEIYLNKDKLNTVLSALGNSIAQEIDNTTMYWSSSQFYEYEKDAIAFDIDDAKICENIKFYAADVRVVHKF